MPYATLPYKPAYHAHIHLHTILDMKSNFLAIAKSKLTNPAYGFHNYKGINDKS